MRIKNFNEFNCLEGFGMVKVNYHVTLNWNDSKMAYDFDMWVWNI